MITYVSRAHYPKGRFTRSYSAAPSTNVRRTPSARLVIGKPRWTDVRSSNTCSTHGIGLKVRGFVPNSFLKGRLTA
eukprot:5038138-Pleurochrysis_carterae.AAC.1